ncbi:MAG: tetratricopeptide repeat protein, partial [Gammaproteobacteria bacterium]
MNLKNRVLTGLSVLIACGMMVSGPAVAQDDDERDNQKTKEAQAVSKEVYDRIQKAQELIDADDEQAALKILNSLKGKKGITEYELQNVLNYIGFVNYNLENIPAAMAAYEEMIRIPSIEPQIKKTTLYTLAQLNTMEENYEKALSLLDEYFVIETNPAPDNYILYAQVLYQLNRYPEMVPAVENAIAVAQRRELQPKEDWYVLLNFAYFQQEDYEKVRDIQKILLVNWPKKRYWFSLAGAYTELGEEQNLVGADDAAMTQGLREREAELVTMAQLYMQHEVPYKAAVLLSGEMETGRVEKNAKNYRLLSQAWSLAAEDEEAIPALQQAARLSPEGELNLRLGNAHLNLGQYGECVAAIKEGIRKGGIKSPDNAQISLGMCLYNQRKYREAIAAFREAGKTRRSRRISNQWINVIN